MREEKRKKERSKKGKERRYLPLRHRDCIILISVLILLKIYSTHFKILLAKERVSLVAQLVKNTPAMQETPVQIPGLGRSTTEGIGYPLQYSWAYLVAQLVKNLPAM